MQDCQLLDETNGSFVTARLPEANYPFVFTTSSRFLSRKDIVLVLVGRRTSCLSLLRIRLTYIGGKSYERKGKKSVRNLFVSLFRPAGRQKSFDDCQ